MKRKKWTEEEESTLITKYSDLFKSGTLQKLKTREKKFDPIAQHVNALHHLRDPISFPFLWSWRDVSIKIQNMRHQYLGVKQKIRIPPSSSSSSSASPPRFNWPDGPNHWHNFLNYKSVFGDIDLDDDNTTATTNITTSNPNSNDIAFDADADHIFHFEDSDNVLGLEIGMDCEEEEEEEEDGEFDGNEEKDGVIREVRKRAKREVEWEGAWGRREMDRRLRAEREFEEGERGRLKKRRMMEERREEEEMEWRERMVGMQIEHEKQMMQMHADACHGQMQVLGLLVRLVCQFFGSGGDGLGGGMGVMPQQVLQHPGSLVGDNGKTDGNSDPHFM